MNEPGKGLVSIIILSYKNIDGIFDTLKSILRQDYPAIEVIVSDDGSPGFPEREEEIRAVAESGRLKRVVLRHAPVNQGTVKNINGALSDARGEYIKLLAAEDCLAEDCSVSDFVRFAEETGAGVIFARMRGVTETGEYRDELASCESDYDLLRSYDVTKQRNRLFKRNYLPAPAAFIRREIFDRYGLFDEDIRLIEDYPYWIMLSNNNVLFSYLDKTEALYRLSGVSSAGSYSEMFMKDLKVIYRKYIFPNDRRFGLMQKPYNLLKRLGLCYYTEKAKLPKRGVPGKAAFWLLFWPFELYTGAQARKVARKNADR